MAGMTQMNTGVGAGNLPMGLPAFGASRGLPASVRQQAAGVVPVVPGGMQQAPLPPAIVLSSAAGTADREERAAAKAQQPKAA
jgi:hypothetical protein